MPDLVVEALSVSFPGLAAPVLDVPALAIRAGERVAITGPSGSGKSTLINMLTGLDRPRQGRILWDGTDLAALGEGGRDRWRAAHVGLVMQDFHLFPGLDALENVLLPARLGRFHVPADLKDRARTLLARVGLTRPGQSIETLSRGEMQRVAVARALLNKPDLLVADEPTASLDAEAGRVVADLLIELATAEGATLIAVTHDERLATRTDRRIALKAGRVVADGPVSPAAREARP